MPRYADLKVSGVPRYTVNFSTSDYFDAVANNTPETTDKFTWVMIFAPLVRRMQAGSYENPIHPFSFEGSINNPYLYGRNEHELRWYVPDGTGYPYATCQGGLEFNRINVVVGTFDRGRLSLWHNGEYDIDESGVSTSVFYNVAPNKLRLLVKADRSSPAAMWMVGGFLWSSDTILFDRGAIEDWVFNTLAEDLREGRPFRHWKASPQAGTDYVWWGEDASDRWFDRVSNAELAGTAKILRSAKSVSARYDGKTQFRPTDIAGLVAWYRADLGVTLETGVKYWQDLSGVQPSYLQQLTGSKQPTLVPAGVDFANTPSIQFNAASQQGLIIPVNSFQTGTGANITAGTIACVAKHLGDVSYGMICSWRPASNPSGGGLELYQDVDGGEYNAGAASAGVSSLSSTLAVGDARRFIATMGPATPTPVELWEDGASTGVGGGSNSVVIYEDDDFGIGARANDTLHNSVSIPELLCYNRALTSEEISSLDAYLGRHVPV